MCSLASNLDFSVIFVCVISSFINFRTCKFVTICYFYYYYYYLAVCIMDREYV